MFSHFFSNKLFTLSQPVFLPEDSCIAQLTSITHEAQTNFDNNPPLDVRGVFFDIFKCFDIVWHKGLLEGELLSLLECYLRDRKQGIVLNGQVLDKS